SVEGPGGDSQYQRHTPFGATRSTTPIPGFPSDLTFTGQHNDGDLDLMYFGARFYDPTLGQFASPDKILADGLNRYAYVRNNPLLLTDPTGRCAQVLFDYCLDAIATGGAPESLGTRRLSLNTNLPRGVGVEATMAAIDQIQVGDPDAATASGPVWDYARDLVDVAAQSGTVVPSSSGSGYQLSDCVGDGWCDVYWRENVGSRLFGVRNTKLEDLAAYEVAGLATARLVSGAPLSSNAPSQSRACSFAADVEVSLADGTKKPISQISVGDVVLAAEPETGLVVGRRVEMVFVHTDTLLGMRIQGDVVLTTEDHPFWNQTEQSYERADALSIGDLLLSPSGDLVAFEGFVPGSARQEFAYNLAVEEVHTFFVSAGEHEVLVHNKCPNLPSWKKLEVDMAHISSGHMPGGSRVSSQKGIFENMTQRQVRAAVRDAYNGGKRMQTQVGPDGHVRVRVRGEGGGRTIEMWVNTSTRRIETAYPL
ncbi:MAG: RHS repeat-associated core domain-containing protein, partial [Actinomycetota bacterium]